jgi:hypothetical protein
MVSSGSAASASLLQAAADEKQPFGALFLHHRAVFGEGINTGQEVFGMVRCGNT